jgi:3-methyladenine DNA glycosylase Mpg
VHAGAVKTALTLLNDFFLVSACTEHSPAVTAAASLLIALAVCIQDLDEESNTAAGDNGNKTNGSKSKSESEPIAVAVKEQKYTLESFTSRSRRHSLSISRGQARLCSAMHVSEADIDRAVGDIVRAQLQFLTDVDGKIIGVSPDSPK